MSQTARNLFQQLISLLFFNSLVSPVKAGLDMGRCCQRRARELIVPLDKNPWTACAIGVSITNPLKQTFDSINATKSWAVENCPGYQLSALDQWLQPLAEWFTPYLTLLLLCPIGENVEDDKAQEEDDKAKGWKKLWNKIVNSKLWTLFSSAENQLESKKSNIAHKILEWVNILGDPASAIWGGIAQIKMDTWVARKLWSLKEGEGYRKNMLGMAVMASQTPMDRKLGEKLTSEFVVNGLLSMTEAAFPPRKGGTAPLGWEEAPESVTQLQNCLLAAEKMSLQSLFTSDAQPRAIGTELGSVFGPQQSLRECLKRLKIGLVSWPSSSTQNPDTLEGAIDKVIDDKNPRMDDILSFDKTKFSTTLEAGIGTLLDARIKFVNGILLPVVTHFVTTAAAFYHAYQKIGDNDTSHSLAYGALFSWLLLVVVVGNSVAASVNAKVVKTTIQEQFTLRGIRVPLRARYFNNREWQCWLTDIGVETRFSKGVQQNSPENNSEFKPASDIAFGFWFYIKFMVGQLIGWACVAFFGSCAITISYTTPTVGWGCRSFNHLLYIMLSFLIAMTQVLRHGVERIYKPSPSAPKTNTPLLVTSMRFLYAIFVLVNAFVLIVGTIFHFAGLYRSYTCDRIFGPSTSIVQLLAYTELHVHNARIYWYSTGYVAYCAAWMGCAIAVAFRKYIQLGIQLQFAGSVSDLGVGKSGEKSEVGKEGRKLISSVVVKGEATDKISPVSKV